MSYVTLTTGNVMDLYKAITPIRGEVSRLCSENRLRPVLIVDEAHHLRTDVLEDHREDMSAWRSGQSPGSQGRASEATGRSGYSAQMQRPSRTYV